MGIPLVYTLWLSYNPREVDLSRVRREIEDIKKEGFCILLRRLSPSEVFIEYTHKDGDLLENFDDLVLAVRDRLLEAFKTRVYELGLLRPEQSTLCSRCGACREVSQFEFVSSIASVLKERGILKDEHLEFIKRYSEKFGTEEAKISSRMDAGATLRFLIGLVILSEQGVKIPESIAGYTYPFQAYTRELGKNPKRIRNILKLLEACVGTTLKKPFSLGKRVILEDLEFAEAGEPEKEAL